MTLLVGRQEWHPACKKTQWWGAGMVLSLMAAKQTILDLLDAYRDHP